MKGKLNRNSWHKYRHTVTVYVFLTALMVFINILNEDFFALGNFKNLLRSFFPLFMAALGQTLIILTGGINLSLGGIVALCNAIRVISMNLNSAWGSVPVLGAAIAVGLACGAANGVLVAKGHLTPITVTVAITTAFDGMILLPMPSPGGSVHRAFARFLTWEYSGTVSFLLFILILCLVRSLANSTPCGKALRAIGGSENAAYSTSIWVGKIKFYAYCLTGPLCAIAGILLSAQMNSTDAIIRKDYTMSAITATMVDGAAMTGAMGDPLDTIVGVPIISIINNILNPFGVSSFYQSIYRGLILIIALSLSTLHKRCQGLWGLTIKDRKVR